MADVRQSSDSLQFRFAEVEAAAARELVLSRSPAERDRLGLRFEELGRAGGLIVCDAFPHVLFNRSVALGVADVATDDVLAELLSKLNVAGRPPNFQVNVTPCARPSDLVERLLARGLTPFRRDMVVLVRGVEPATVPPTRFRIARALPEHGAAVGEILGSSFGVPEPLHASFGGAVTREGCHVFCAFDGEKAVAAGVLLVVGRTGYLALGATLPEYRGEGAHDALIATRIDAAREAGCDIVLVDTGTPVPGEPSPSLDNVRRAGFTECFVRKSLVANGTTWTGRS